MSKTTISSVVGFHLRRLAKHLGLLKVTKRTLRNRYVRHIKNIKKKSKIKIGFIVRESSKWSYAGLYELLKLNKLFEPVVLIVDQQHELCNLSDNIKFFSRYNYIVMKNKDDFINQDIDIVFYEQPWFDLGGDFTPEKLSEYALTMYVPYGIELDKNDKLFQDCARFYKSVYKIFAFNDFACREWLRHGCKNTVVVGHPRLDAYLDNISQNDKFWKSKDKVRIIYAPHHSFGDSILKQASWEWNGNHILELAKNNQDTTEWVFKPHPRFKLALGQLLNDSDRAQAVYDEWEQVGQIYNQGDYFELFKTADIMISDCCSFKIEWLPTGKPFVQLLSHYPDAHVYRGIDYFSSAYYKANTIKEIDMYFDMLVKEKRDPNKMARSILATQIPLGASKNIYEYLIKELQ